MKKVVLKVVFDRRKVASDTKVAPVEIEVYHKRMRRWISTGVKVLKNQWSDKTRVKGVWNASQLNETISTTYNQIHAYVISVQESGEEFDFNAMNSYFNRGIVKRTSFIDFLQKRIEERTDLTPDTRRHHRSFRNLLIEYGKIVTFRDLDTKHLVEFDDYLHERFDNPNTRLSQHRMFKTYIHQAIRLGELDKDPYLNFKIDRRGKPATRNYLTQAEVTLFRDAELDGVLDKARDLFLFMCYTALAYEDARKFNWFTDVVNDGTRYSFKDRRNKTDEEYYIVIVPDCLRILEKYNHVLPWMSNQKLNLYLKIAAKKAGLAKEPTSHWGRHTAAMLALNGGIPIEQVSRMLAHASINTTKVYAHLLQKTMDDAYDKMADLWGKKKD